MSIQIIGRRRPYLGKNVGDSHIKTLYHFIINLVVGRHIKSGEELTTHAPPIAIA
jgi:hypothetical protein